MAPVLTSNPLEDWHEDIGPVLWWRFPVNEPPYVGSPLDADWPGYHTHWSVIPVPYPPGTFAQKVIQILKRDKYDRSTFGIVQGYGMKYLP